MMTVIKYRLPGFIDGDHLSVGPGPKLKCTKKHNLDPGLNPGRQLKDEECGYSSRY